MEDLDKRYQTMLILWAALLMSVVMFFVMALIAGGQSTEGSNVPYTPVVSMVLTGVGTFMVGLSFVVKHKLLERSVEQQNIGLVQQALVVACALCEVAALLGIVLRFAMKDPYYYVVFIIAAVGEVFHFPRKSQLLAATYKTRSQQTLQN